MTAELDRANQELAAAQAERNALDASRAQVDARIALAARARHDAIGAPALGAIVPLEAGEPGKGAYNWIGLRVETRGVDPDHLNEWRVSGTLYQLHEWGTPKYRWAPMGDRQASLTQREFNRLPEVVRQATAKSVADHFNTAEPPRRRRWFRR